MKKIVLCLIINTLFFSCKSENNKDKAWSELPQVTNLASLKQTEFMTTLENPIASDKNNIYAPAFLFVWEQIKHELKSPIVVSESNSNDFKLLNNSNSYLHSLNDGEYSTSVIVEGNEISAKAYFNKSLPFETKLQLLDDPIVFNGKTKVTAFGMKYFDEQADNFTKILHYKNDDNFILQLTPKDKQHEIILVKGLQPFQTLAEALKQTNLLITKGKKENMDAKQSWKYKIEEEDIFSIPSIKFNIDTNYKNIELQQFFTQNKEKHLVIEAYQRIGFVLNENGAVVESEARSVVDSIGEESTIKHPKSMIFNKPFLVIVKRKNQANPYFVMNIANTELLQKQ